MAVVIDVKVGESVSIDGGRAVVTLLEKSGQRARLSFKADDDVKIQHVTRRIETGAAQAKKGLRLVAA
jgi:hypothetical protein